LLLRVDENDKCEHVNFYHDLTLLDWKQYDAIVISDYCKGFLNEEDIKYISTQHPLTFLDTKKLLGNWADNITFIKLNSIEYNQNKEILSSSSILFSKVIKTRGKHGCNYQNKNYPTIDVPVKDVSGAGDTFLAGLVAEYAKSSNIESAIKFAQECTTVVVQKSGVSTI
jgi:bifunctional ADP-heptose synthase (sugar kinase/adenylyltransferase)